MAEREEVKKLIKKFMMPFAEQHGFIFYRPTILIREYKDIIHIINFDLRIGGFTCNIAIQPLYIPANSIVLSFGNRLSKFKVMLKESWSYDNPEPSFMQIIELLQANAIPWFAEAGSPQGIVSFIEKGWNEDFSVIVGFPPASKYLYLGLSYLYIGQYDLADKALETVSELYKDDKRDWAMEIGQMVNDLSVLAKNNSMEIPEKLKGYIEKNRIALKLKCF